MREYFHEDGKKLTQMELLELSLELIEDLREKNKWILFLVGANAMAWLALILSILGIIGC